MALSVCDAFSDSSPRGEEIKWLDRDGETQMGSSEAADTIGSVIVTAMIADEKQRTMAPTGAMTTLRLHFGLLASILDYARTAMQPKNCRSMSTA